MIRWQISRKPKHPRQGIVAVLVAVSLIVLIGVVCTLTYFYFSREHTGWFGKSARLGTLFLMLFFGTTFGYTVMSRMSTLIGRIEFLLSDAFGLIR